MGLSDPLIRGVSVKPTFNVGRFNKASGMKSYEAGRQEHAKAMSPDFAGY